MNHAWMVRAGHGAAYVHLFVGESIAAIGVSAPDNTVLSKVASKEQARAWVHAAQPGWNANKVGAEASLLWRFVQEVSVGDPVVTYDPSTRLYHLGRITGPADDKPIEDTYLRVVRSVDWTATAPRDGLSSTSLNQLGSIMALFKLSMETWSELEAASKGETSPPTPPTPPLDEETEVALEATEADDVENAAFQRIDDAILALSPESMEHFVAHLLRGLGYRARVSPKGKDRGVDVFASPDGLGLESPRVFVEVKHRKGKMGPDALRSFLHGRHPADRNLFVSTGGFTQEARYEAERSAKPVELMAVPELRRLLVDVYDRMPRAGQDMISLRKVYWVEG